MSPDPKWKIYQDAACAIVHDLRERLDLAVVEGAQPVPGLSVPEWNIDGKAIRTRDGALLLIEARHYASRLCKKNLAAFAYTVKDTGGVGGFTVSPLPLQLGAAIIAAANNIVHLQATPDSTVDDYMVELLGQAFHKTSINESAAMTDSAHAEVWSNGVRVDND